MWIVRSFWSQDKVWEDRILLADHKYALGRDRDSSPLKSLSNGTLPLLWQDTRAHKHEGDIVVGPMLHLPQGAQPSIPPARSETHPITQVLRDLRQVPSSISSVSSSSSVVESTFSLPPLLNDREELYYPPDAPELRFICRNEKKQHTLLEQGEKWLSDPSKGRNPNDSATWKNSGDHDEDLLLNNDPGWQIRHGDVIKIGSDLALIFRWEPMTFGVHDVDPDPIFEAQCDDAFKLGIRTVQMKTYKGSPLALSGWLTPRLLEASEVAKVVAPAKIAAYLSRRIVTPGYLRKCLALARSYSSTTHSSNRWYGWPAPLPAEDVPKGYDYSKMADYLSLSKTGPARELKSRVETRVQEICLAGKIEVLSGLTVLYVTTETEADVAKKAQSNDLIALRALGASLHVLHTTETGLSQNVIGAWINELKVGATRRWQAAAASDPAGKRWLPPENGMLLLAPSSTSVQAQMLLAEIAAEQEVRIAAPIEGFRSGLKIILFTRCFNNDQTVLGKTGAEFKALASKQGVTMSLQTTAAAAVTVAPAVAQTSAGALPARSAAAGIGSTEQQPPARTVPRRRRVVAPRSESADPDPTPQTAPTQPTRASDSALQHATQAGSAVPPAAAAATVAPANAGTAQQRQQPPPPAQRAGSSLRRRVVAGAAGTQGASIAATGTLGLSVVEEAAEEAEPKSARFRKYLEAESRGETMDIHSDIGLSAGTQAATQEAGGSQDASPESAERREASRTQQRARTLVLDTQATEQSPAERERQEQTDAKFRENMKQAREKVRANEAELDAEPIGEIAPASKTGRSAAARSIAGTRGKALQQQKQQQQQQQEQPAEISAEDQALEDLRAYREMEMDEEMWSPKLSYIQITQIPMIRRDRQQTQQVGYTPDHNSQVPNFKKFRRAHLQTRKRPVALELPEANDYGLGDAYRLNAVDNINQEIESGPQSHSQRAATTRTTSGRYRRGGPGAFDEHESDNDPEEILPAPANIRQTGTAASRINDVTGGAQRRKKRRLALSDSDEEEDDALVPPANQPKRRGATAASASAAGATKSTRGAVSTASAQQSMVSSLGGGGGQRDSAIAGGGTSATLSSIAPMEIAQTSTSAAGTGTGAGTGAGEGARKRRRVVAAANRAKGDDSDEDAFAFSSKSRRQR